MGSLVTTFREYIRWFQMESAYGYWIWFHVRRTYCGLYRDTAGRLTLLRQEPIGEQPSTSRFLLPIPLAEISSRERCLSYLRRHLYDYGFPHSRRSYLGPRIADAVLFSAHRHASSTIDADEEVIFERLIGETMLRFSPPAMLMGPTYQTAGVADEVLIVDSEEQMRSGYYHQEPLDDRTIVIDAQDLTDPTVMVDSTSVMDDQARPRGRDASEIVIDKLNPEMWVNGCDVKEEVGPCCICLEELSSAARLIKMKCSHIFHESCILNWLKQRNSCPLCRCPVV